MMENTVGFYLGNRRVAPRRAPISNNWPEKDGTNWVPSTGPRMEGASWFLGKTTNETVHC